MSAEAVKTLVQALISCRLYYCNSLFYGITKGLMSRLQSVQNAAAHLVSGARRYGHITRVLQELQRHSVRRRVDFKMATFVYLSLSGIAAAYLATDCQLVSDKGQRSSSAAFCHIKDARCETNIQQLWRLKTVADLKLWNSFPAELRVTS